MYTFSQPRITSLSVIKTSPNNVVLKEIQQNVGATQETGINGGFFYNRDLLSIAVNNDVPVRGVKNGYGSGWFNEKYARGTLVWDKRMRTYTVQVVKSVDELKVSDRSAYWAQGGISMSLQDDANWRRIAEEQNMPNMDGKTRRSAAVYASTANLWLVISNEQCTAKEFRAAIKAMIPDVVDGVFLDGGGSTQMRCEQLTFAGDGRKVVQMIALTYQTNVGTV